MSLINCQNLEQILKINSDTWTIDAHHSLCHKSLREIHHLCLRKGVRPTSFLIKLSLTFSCAPNLILPEKLII